MASNSLSPNTIEVAPRNRSLSNAETIASSTFSNPLLTPSTLSCASSVLEDPELALRPNPGCEADFEVDNNPFAFSPGQLNSLFNPKSLSAFQALGGLEGIVRGLQTDVKAGLGRDETGISSPISFHDAVGKSKSIAPKSPASLPSSTSDPFSDRIRVFKRNVLPPKKATSLWKLMWNAYNDKVLILLTGAAVVSLSLGIYETLGVEHAADDPAPVDWVEGVAICVAIIIVTVVGSLNDWQKEKAFVKLNAKKDDREIKVIRSGKSFMINVHDILVGDVLHLEPGDLVPVDGIFIDGHDVKCDESSATGESDALKKTPGDEVFRSIESGQTKKELDPFIISGAKVLEGMGTFVCTSVGVNSSFGKIIMSVRTETEATPLQKKLEKLAMAIAYLGSASAALLFVILLIRFLAGLPNDVRDSTVKASAFVDILIVAVTIIVVAVPEGLPLAVTLALAFATTRLLKENNLVRLLRASETMGNATTICSDKTGTLTTNKMAVVAGTFGSTSFGNATETEKPAEQTASQWAAMLPRVNRAMIVQSVAINSTAFESEEDGKTVFLGSKTETALLQLAKDHLGLQSLRETRANEQVVQMMPFDSNKKCMAAVVKTGAGYRLLVKGASEILLKCCTEILEPQGSYPGPLSKPRAKALRAAIESYASMSLRTIGLVYRDYPEWPPASAELVEGQVQLASLLRGLVFIGVVGIQDPVRPGVPEAVSKAQHAGVVVRMVTGDNMTTAKAIATACGIYTDGGVVMEGPRFRRLSEGEMSAVLPRLQVLARSSPEDKRILVTRLKALGETVAVTGDGTNDAPALKAADVGFSMGISGTEVAKEASAIVLMDDNFASIITALKWGRAVNDAVQKFLQFQITVNITAVLLAFITALYSPEMKPVLKAVQLLWVNLIMDTFAALALATDPPVDKILNRQPQGKKAPLITVNMWKMIIGQAIFQLVTTLVLYFAGPQILNYSELDSVKMIELDTIIFNTFVWMQIFNQFNNRRLDNKFNILEGLHRNHFFIFISILMVGLQVTIIFFGSRAFAIAPNGLDATQWAICIVVALGCLPWAVLVRLFPDAWFATIAGIVGRPVVLAYGALGKVFRRIGSLFRNKTTETPAEDAEAAVLEPVIAEPVIAEPAVSPPAIVVCETFQVQITEPEVNEKR